MANYPEFNPDSTTEDATYAVTRQTTISGEKELADNITLLFDGGRLIGNGILKGNNIRIEAGVRHILDPRITFSGSWDVREVYPEWFGNTNMEDREAQVAYVDREQRKKTATILYPRDCTAMLQAAFDLAYTAYRKGGRVVCRNRHKYGVSKPIKIKRGVSFDGGHSDFIPHYSYVNESMPYVSSFAPDGDSLKFMFKINVDGTTVIATPGEPMWETYLNIRMANFPIVKELAHPYYYGNNFDQTLVAGLRGIFNGCGHCSFENINAFGLWQTFSRTTDYTDMLSIRNVVSGWTKKSPDDGDWYQIDLGSTGDSLKIDNIHIYRNAHRDKQFNDKHLRIKNCKGGLVSRIINGSVLISQSTALLVQSIHQEFGHFEIENSQVEINGMAHYKWPAFPAFKLKKQANNRTSFNRVVTIKNVMIFYNHERVDLGKNFFDANNPNEYDIKLEDPKEVVIIENVTRLAQRSYSSASSLFGIRVNHDGFMGNRGCYSIQSKLAGCGGESAILNNVVAYSQGVYPQILDQDVYTEKAFPVGNKSLPTGTYHYQAVALIDKKRQLGFIPNNFDDAEPKSINVAETGKMVGMVFSGDTYVGLSIRLYRWRGTSKALPTAAKIAYIDIPVCTSNNYVYDLGEYVLFGDSWDEDYYENIKVQHSASYQEIGDNVHVVTHEKPTSGTWKAGDTITIKNGLRWYYDGTTWRS